MTEITLLTEDQIWGSKKDKQLEVLYKYGTKAAVTDLCVLTGNDLCENTKCNIDEDMSLKGRVGSYWTKTAGQGRVCMVCEKDWASNEVLYKRYGAIRPVINSYEIFSLLYPYRYKGFNGCEEVEYGEYPQYAVDSNMQNLLESEYNRGMKKTGKIYTFDSSNWYDYNCGMKLLTYDEYEYHGKKYIRVSANYYYEFKYKLSNGEKYKTGDYVWVEVSPVKWLIDEKSELLISKYGLVSGLRFFNNIQFYHGDFTTTDIKKYLDKYMIHELFEQKSTFNTLDVEKEEHELKRKSTYVKNPYGFKFDDVSEEDIIKGAIESGVAVFLHGPSSEGKSARVKQIDPECEIIYLRNASPESINGKSVYNQSNGEMIDIKPTWLKRLEEKCEREPNKYHILFFDEITNALPSIQGIAFNIVLDKEVNGIWKLPENARIVAAGNEMEESLSANNLAEPLFNRFAHVYIKTTTEKWLKWASENNIHPAIYSYIAYKRGETLRSKYDGVKPNADPRKWEMASKMLYKTGNPEMLRALVGEEITREFAEFCNQSVITLDDVLNDNYNESDLVILNTSEKYATVTGLTGVDVDNLKKVRDFVSKLGKEFVGIFDSLWTHGDEERLETLAEIMDRGIKKYER